MTCLIPKLIFKTTLYVTADHMLVNADRSSAINLLSSCSNGGKSVIIYSSVNSIKLGLQSSDSKHFIDKRFRARQNVKCC